MKNSTESSSWEKLDVGKTLRGLVAATMVALAPAPGAEAALRTDNVPEAAGELSQIPKYTAEQQERVERMEKFLLGFFSEGGEGWKFLTLTPLKSVSVEILETLTNYGAEAIERNEDPIKAFADGKSLSDYFYRMHANEPLERNDRFAIGVSRLLELISEAAAARH